LSTRKKLLFAIGFTCALFLAWEGFARLFGVSKCGPVEPDAGNWEEMIGDRNTLWKMRSNYVIPSPHGPPTRINAVGLRDSLLPLTAGGHAKAANERRILTTGDSSVYGWGVPTGQTFQEVLEQKLKAQWPTYHFEVINMGVPGYSTEQSLRQLSELGQGYSPDLLVVSNVFSDANFDHFQDAEALVLANPKPSGTAKLLQQSRSYCAVFMGWQNKMARRGQQSNRVLMPGLPRDARWVSNPDRFGVDARVPLPRFVANIGSMVDWAQSVGAKTVLAPLAQEWDAGRWSANGLPQPAKGQALPWTPYRDALVSIARDRGLIHVPFYTAFSQSHKPARELFSDAIHPTPQGARIMAKALFDSIVQHPDLLNLPTANHLPQAIP
jgi:lysophospholipase L1-like esterase